VATYLTTSCAPETDGVRSFIAARKSCVPNEFVTSLKFCLVLFFQEKNKAFTGYFRPTIRDKVLFGYFFFQEKELQLLDGIAFSI
jgi:hypothetical protein